MAAPSMSTDGILLERALVAFQPLAVLGSEPDRVLVGHVDARDRGGAVRVHLRRQLARDLDRLHLRGEGTAEHPFNEVLDPLLEVAQNADDSPSLGPRPRLRDGAPLRGLRGVNPRARPNRRVGGREQIGRAHV